MRFLIYSLILLASNSVFSQEQYGFVDIELALKESSFGKKIIAQLEKESQKFQKDLQKEEESLDNKLIQFEKQKLILSKDKIQAKEKDLQKEAVELRNSYEKRQEELLKKEQNLLKSFQDKVETIAPIIAQEQKVKFIIEKRQNPFIYLPNKKDLTPFFIEKLR